jgi:hypothetical protein
VWPWLAPATGLMLVLFVTVGPRPDAVVSRESPTLWPTSGYGAVMAYVPADSLSRQNGVPIDRIEWTTGGALPSESPPYAPVGTNTLKP